MIKTEVYNGIVDETDTGIVGITHPIDTGKWSECTGSMIAPNVVLTAKHCVFKNVLKTVQCDAEGHSPDGNQVSDILNPDLIKIYNKTAIDVNSPMDVNVRYILTTYDNYICNNDIALLILDKNTNLPVYNIEYNQNNYGIDVRDVGFGLTENNINGIRHSAYTKISNIGPGITSDGTYLGKFELEAGVSMCHGDSGGPLFNLDGNIIAISSRGTDCSIGQNVFGELSGYKDFVDNGIALANNQISYDNALTVIDSLGSTDIGGSGCSTAKKPTDSFTLLVVIGFFIVSRFFK